MSQPEQLKLGLDSRRLRAWLLVFFLALAIPTALLAVQAYRQLQWESFHQHREQATALATSIDQRLATAVASEDRRAFSDYLFVSAAGSSNLLARSPLANFPVEAELPGVIGYFQVDNDGKFSSPVLPLDDPQLLGIDGEERAARQGLHDRLRELLIDNALVERQNQSLIVDQPPRQQAANPIADSASFDIAESEPNSSATFDADSDFDRQGAGNTSSQPAPAEQRLAEGIDSSSPQVDDRLDNAQARFELLEERRRTAANTPDIKKASKQVSELELDQPLQAETAGEAPTLSQPARVPRSKRSEQVYLPSGQLQFRDDELGRSASIETFESELDPMQFSQLDSGEFVLYRKVWRDQQKLIQGLLIDQGEFLAATVAGAFVRSELSQVADLVVAFQGDIVDSLGSEHRYTSKMTPLSGTLLQRHQFAAPLAGLELLFIARELPMSAGTKVLLWGTALLGLLLSGGLFAIYRAGLRQITLGQQQQDFIAAVSHELKTPLTSIRMYSEMLREGWASPEKTRGYYDFIHDESERLSRLIENVLQLARMTRNELALNVQPTQLTAVVDMLRSKLESPVRQAGFQLDIHCAENTSGLQIETDLDCLTQVFINLVDNAIKFSAETAQQAVHLRVTADGGWAEFSVRDFGPGIARDQMKKIFRLFYRPAGELTRETAGTGIGLALVKQLVTALGGVIDVRNRSPGAEFIIRLPISS